ncbi:hypothetical protein MCHIJ_31870 [Mycolicibacterium chitae]|uniref:Secreted protein n=1 Tax=Mycolicibacterium chitae TaxID=1792 RepID=A0A448I4U6_MYCCI|nr:hypothetical protein [Mycolicibacterium chitae]MCV7106336.1 hypothetical protein [Mycolicibacterium chitae]BBZ03750.1 hypothetical protein MCHIJ_31870 [Mycolicibacterium chitae]VEG47405.1 Uncharacterised protein [Mycolicibacterium chitae]
MLVRRLAAAGALALFATCAGGVAVAHAQPGNCVSWLGARDTGQCISESNGGLPQVGFNGWGVETGPLLPGRSIDIPLG